MDVVVEVALRGYDSQQQMKHNVSPIEYLARNIILDALLVKSIPVKRAVLSGTAAARIFYMDKSAAYFSVFMKNA